MVRSRSFQLSVLVLVSDPPVDAFFSERDEEEVREGGYGQ